jgi:hypothetical protein
VPFYRTFGLLVASEIEFPELSPADGDTPDISIRRTAMDTPAAPGSEVLRTKRRGTFHVREGREILVEPPQVADYEFQRHLIVNRVMALLLRQRGWLPVHASAVLIRNFGVLFCGTSGSGKSTIAAAFYASGNEVISDDISPIRVYQNSGEVLSGRRSLRLSGESQALIERLGIKGDLHLDKHAYTLPAAPLKERVPLQCVYMLAWGDAHHMNRLSSSAAAAALNRESHVALFRPSDALLRAQFRICAEVAAATPVIRLTRPRGFEHISQTLELIIGNSGNG